MPSSAVPHAYLSPPPLLLVLSGPSGAGKDAVISLMRRQHCPHHFVVTATTRPKRPRERDRVSYHFLSTQEFQRRLAAGDFLEHAQVYDNWYGVPRSEVREALQRGQDVVIKTDVQGAATIKRLAPQAVFIFLCAASFEELEARLRQRHTEAPEALKRRLQTARQEMEQLPLFDYMVVNGDGHLREATQRINAIIAAEHSRVPPRVVNL